MHKKERPRYEGGLHMQRNRNPEKVCIHLLPERVIQKINCNAKNNKEIHCFLINPLKFYKHR